MGRGKMAVEKRKYIRFLAKPNTYAALGPRFTKVGKIKDISIGGLAFEYICNSQDSDLQPSQIAIFLSENGFHLANLACRVVCDCPEYADGKNSVPNSVYAINHCAVQFTVITKKQKDELEYFIKHHTQGLAPSSSGMNTPL